MRLLCRLPKRLMSRGQTLALGYPYVIHSAKYLRKNKLLWTSQTLSCRNVQLCRFLTSQLRQQMRGRTSSSPPTQSIHISRASLPSGSACQEWRILDSWPAAGSHRPPARASGAAERSTWALWRNTHNKLTTPSSRRLQERDRIHVFLDKHSWY